MQRRELIQLIAFAVLPGLSVAALEGLVSGLWVSLILAIVGLSYTYPAWGLWGLLIYLPFAGTLTHGFADSSRFTHLIKDFFYIPALCSILINDRAYLKLFWAKIRPLYLPLSALTLCVGISFIWVNIIGENIEPTSGNQFLMGLVGIKTILSYIPLMLCGYYLIHSKDELLFFTRSQVVLVVCCCFLGFIQYLLLTKGICSGNEGLGGPSVYRASLEAQCFVGGAVLYNATAGLVRLPGTFVAPWQWGWFLICSTFFLFAIDVSDPDRRWRIVSAIATGLLIIMSVFSGQRIALALVPIIFIILQILTSANKKFLPIKWGSAVLASGLIVQTVNRVEQRIESLVDRWTISPPHEFMWKQWLWTWNQQDGLWGHGVGAATNAARKFAPTRLIETFHAKIFYEIGPIGLLAFLAVVSAIAFLTFQAYRSIRDRSLKQLALCLWMFVALVSYFPYYYPLDVDPIAIYYWLVAGILLKLPELEKEDRMQEE